MATLTILGHGERVVSVDINLEQDAGDVVDEIAQAIYDYIEAEEPGITVDQQRVEEKADRVALYMLRGNDFAQVSI